LFTPNLGMLPFSSLLHPGGAAHGGWPSDIRAHDPRFHPRSYEDFFSLAFSFFESAHRTAKSEALRRVGLRPEALSGIRGAPALETRAFAGALKSLGKKGDIPPRTGQIRLEATKRIRSKNGGRHFHLWGIRAGEGSGPVATKGAGEPMRACAHADPEPTRNLSAQSRSGPAWETSIFSRARSAYPPLIEEAGPRSRRATTISGSVLGAGQGGDLSNAIETLRGAFHRMPDQAWLLDTTPRNRAAGGSAARRGKDSSSTNEGPRRSIPKFRPGVLGHNLATPIFALGAGSPKGPDGPIGLGAQSLFGQNWAHEAHSRRFIRRWHLPDWHAGRASRGRDFRGIRRSATHPKFRAHVGCTTPKRPLWRGEGT